MNESGLGVRGLSPGGATPPILVMIAGFSVLSLVTVLTYTNAPPIPGAGHGRRGRDARSTGRRSCTARRSSSSTASWSTGRCGATAPTSGPTTAPSTSTASPRSAATARRAPRARRQALASELKQNRYDAATDTLVFTPCEAASLEIQEREWEQYFRRTDPGAGTPASFIKDPAEVKALTAYFAWAAWATRRNRPGKDYSYTNNWPYEPMAGNRPERAPRTSGAP